jgi:formylglycine-generating enzyme required for sulfatase activity
VFACQWDGSAAQVCAFTDIAPVGSAPAGNGYWGQSDLAGNLWEWVFDWQASPYSISPCSDCANTTQAAWRGFRGGYLADPASYLTTTFRSGATPATRNYGVGARCVRAPQ